MAIDQVRRSVTIDLGSDPSLEPGGYLFADRETVAYEAPTKRRVEADHLRTPPVGVTIIHLESGEHHRLGDDEVCDIGPNALVIVRTPVLLLVRPDGLGAIRRDAETVIHLDETTTVTLGFLDDHDHYRQYLGHWEQAGSVSFETCGRQELIDTADAMLGEGAAGTDRAVRSSSGLIGGSGGGDGGSGGNCGSLDPISLLVWAGAEANVLGREVTDVVEELGLGTRRTANRRIEVLRDEGLIQTQTVTKASPGHPDRQLDLGVDVPASDPIPSLLRDALTN